MIPILSETMQALGGPELPGCESRSLFQSRFADPQARDEKDAPDRTKWFNALIARKAEAPKHRHAWLPASASILYAQLKSRLLIDLSGG